MLEVLGQPRPNHWARVWPTGVAMSRWLLAQAPGSLPSHALELGCGMGLVSLTLAHLGLLAEGTDREPLALLFAARNAANNGLGGFSTSRLDWSEPTTLSTQLLVASDVAYELESPGRLLALIHGAGLLGPGGRLVLGVPDERGNLTEELVAALREVSYAHQRTQHVVEWESQLRDITLHVLTRPAGAGGG